MTLPPDYLEGKVAIPTNTSPANLLFDGQWCGHGEPKYDVFNVYVGKENVFSVQLPVPDIEALNPPTVVVTSDSGVTFPIYDSRKHPASVYWLEGEAGSKEPLLQSTFHCPNCDKQRFHVAVGFEIPSDSTGSNDTSWFALAVKCIACEWEDIIFDDETA